MIPRRSAIVCCLLVLVVLGGCVSFTAPDDGSADTDDAEPDPDIEAVFEGAFVHSEDLEDVQGELITEATDGEQTISSADFVYERPYTDHRYEILDMPNEDRIGSIDASNASVSWWYDAERGTASYYATDDPLDSDEIRSFRADEADRQLGLYDLEYRGTDTVADREAHVLDVEAKAEAIEKGISILVGDTEYVYALETVDPADELEVVEQTLWIDTEFDYPLKEELVFEEPDGEQFVITERFESVTFNDGLEDELFAFDPPDEATVEEPYDGE